MPNLAKLILLCSLSFVSVGAMAQAQPYCAAIRGNGELLPAHWGALARTIEVYGAPSAVAGGSSASITAFLLESILMNPSVVNTQDHYERSLKVSFLVKSLQGFTETVFQDRKWKQFFEVLLILAESPQSKNALAQKGSLAKLIQASQVILKGNSPADLDKAFKPLFEATQELKQSEVFFGPAIQRLYSLLSQYKQKPDLRMYRVIRESVTQISESISVLGKFDAKNDKSIFIRDGVLNFQAIAHLFGHIADFYSLSNAQRSVAEGFSKLVDKCSANTTGITWNQIIRQQPDCKFKLKDLISSYFSRNKEDVRIFSKVGQTFPVLISTAVATGRSSEVLLQIKDEFEQTSNPDLGVMMNTSESDFKFGYWGAENNLRKIESSLKQLPEPLKSIDKTKRFLNLGEATWEEVLSLSPAEPGLSSYLPFHSQGKLLVSLGGWSDLHPVPVLKALGCQNVIYLTRKGGDSIFGQGVAKRILNLDSPTWEDLDPENPRAALKNNTGNKTDRTSQWSKMFNLANPNSSYAASLSAASAVVCTDWNAFDIKKDFTAMIEEAYKAPVYESQTLTKYIQIKSLSRVENTFNSDGTYKYVGCIPLK